MSRLLPLSLLAVVLAVMVTGCGGQKVSSDEVPGPPVALTVPEVTKGGSNQLAGGSGSSSSSTSADATPTPTTQSSTGTQSGGTSGTAPSGTSGTQGTTQQPSQQTNGNNTNNGQSQTGGQQPFDDFCKNNPGAC